MNKISYLLSLLFLSTNVAFGQVIYVDSSATGLNTGISWDNAFNDLQNALAIAQAGDSIWVVQGTYFPTDNLDRTISFNIPSGVKLFGGFQGSESNLQERDWDLYPTILSGDIGGVGDSTDNSYTVVYTEVHDTLTQVDGFIICDGNADDDEAVGAYSPFKFGGGVYVVSGSNDAGFNLTNCKLLDNTALYWGGGMFISGLSNSVGIQIKNSLFDSNTGTFGGGLYFTGDMSLISETYFKNTTFNANQSRDGYGSAVYLDHVFGNTVLGINSCIFSNNTVGDNIGGSSGGGALAFIRFGGVSETYLQVKNTEFVKNIGDGDASAIHIYYSSVGSDQTLIDGCVFEENKGGAVINNASTQGNLDNVFIVNNTKFVNNNSIAVSGDCNEINNCLFKNNSWNYGGSTMNNDFSTVINQCTFIKTDTTKRSGIWVGVPTQINNSLFYSAVPYTDTIIRGAAPVALNNCLLTAPTCDTSILMAEDTLLTCNNVITGVVPDFRDPANLDYRLTACSPGVDAGDNSLFDTTLYPIDVSGEPRVINGLIDIGAFESPVSIQLNSIQHVTCPGGMDGVVMPIFNGHAPFEYQWTTNNTLGNGIDSLVAGIYDLVITDSSGCTDSIMFELLEPELFDVVFETIPVTCPDGIDGLAEAFVSGGTASYEFLWSNGETDNVATNLSGGLQYLTVTDGNNCMHLDSVWITSPEAIMVEGDIVNATTSTSNDGRIEITTITGGTSPYSLEWSTGDTTNIIDELVSGDYILTVTDANDCVFTIGFLVSFLEGLDNVEKLKILVYPNPATNGVFVENITNESIRSVGLVNQLGQVTYLSNLTSGYIEFPNLVNGVYVLEIKTENGKLVKHLLILD